MVQPLKAWLKVWLSSEEVIQQNAAKDIGCLGSLLKQRVNEGRDRRPLSKDN